MAQVLIRGLDEKTVERWKARAKANGRSLQAEIKDYLERQVAVDPAAARKMVEDLQRSWGGKKFSSSVKIIRRMRDGGGRAA